MIMIFQNNLFFKDRASIDFVVDQVVKFAKETRAKNVDWEVDLGCGSSAGTKYADHCSFNLQTFIS